MRHPKVATIVVHDMDRNRVPAASKESLRTHFSDLEPECDLARGYAEYYRKGISNGTGGNEPVIARGVNPQHSSQWATCDTDWMCLYHWWLTSDTLHLGGRTEERWTAGYLLPQVSL